MKNSIVLFCIFISLTAYSQVPGYFGRRAVVSYAVWAHPNVNLLANSPSSNGIVLDRTHAFSLDYIVSHRASICFGFQFSRIGMNFPGEYYRNFIYTGSDKYPAYLHAKGASVGLKFFARDKIAPLGRYIKWDALVMFNKLVYDPNDVYDQSENVRLTEVDENVNSFGGGFALSFGRQRILFDRIVLDGGFRMAFVLCPVEYTSDYAREFYYVTERLVFNQLVNFRIGIGFLAF